MALLSLPRTEAGHMIPWKGQGVGLNMPHVPHTLPLCAGQYPMWQDPAWPVPNALMFL